MRARGGIAAPFAQPAGLSKTTQADQLHGLALGDGRGDRADQCVEGVGGGGFARARFSGDGVNEAPACSCVLRCGGEDAVTLPMHARPCNPRALT